MKKLFFLTLIVFLFIGSCSKNNLRSQWLIPENEVEDGGPGKDGIPAIMNPEFISIDEVDFLSDNDLVIGVILNGEIKAYPHPILDWHEIVNDKVDDINIALTYCPLTGTAIAWNRTFGNSTTTFGVSGKLYNSNLIPYDRETDSYWSQIGLNCVNGELIGSVIETFPVLETSWKTWKKLYPDAEIMSTNTGFSRDYNRYPYGAYRTNNSSLLFPVSPFDDRLLSKERVLGVLNMGANKVYSINKFTEPQVIFDTVGSDKLIIIGSKEDNFIVAFFGDDALNNLTIDLTELPVIAKDADGNELDITGKVVNGPLAGLQLEQPTAFMGYWFSFGAFYPGIEIYE